MRSALGIRRCVLTVQSGYTNKPFLFPYLFVRNEDSPSAHSIAWTLQQILLAHNELCFFPRRSETSKAWTLLLMHQGRQTEVQDFRSQANSGPECDRNGKAPRRFYWLGCSFTLTCFPCSGAELAQAQTVCRAHRESWSLCTVCVYI